MIVDYKETFIEKAKRIHGDKYDYSKVEYINGHTKICIVCPIHGEFYQAPHKHLQGQGCPQCGREKTRQSTLLTKEEFIKKANCVHNNKYNYDKINYINNSTKVAITCPKHGVYYQIPKSHLMGCGCPICAQEQRTAKQTKSQEKFIQEAIIIHGDKYDYSKVKYKNSSSKVCIICPQHGEFHQSPNKHIRGQGCPQCGGSQNYDTNGFIERAKTVHNDKYDYSKTEYINNRSKVCIICHQHDKNNNEHGEFWQEASSHLSGNGCPKCGYIISQQENQLVSFIQSILPSDCEIYQNDRTVLNNKELDIYIPTHNIAIEYNGLLWHSEKYGKDKFYHLNKTIECKNKGIKLIHIFEDEWLNKNNIVKSKLKQLLNANYSLERVYARKCTIRPIKVQESALFLDLNHIQGSCNATVHLGCYCNDKVIGVMSFKKERKDNNNWELTRFATDINKHCIGVGGKLFSYFIKNYDYNEIKSFADRRWTLDEKDNLYIKLGFQLETILDSDYRYYNNKSTNIERIHKFNFRKQILHKKYGLSLDMSEKEMVEELGFYRIWDCGLLKYVFKNEKINN